MCFGEANIQHWNPVIYEKSQQNQWRKKTNKDLKSQQKEQCGVLQLFVCKTRHKCCWWLCGVGESIKKFWVFEKWVGEYENVTLLGVMFGMAGGCSTWFAAACLEVHRSDTSHVRTWEGWVRSGSVNSPGITMWKNHPTVTFIWWRNCEQIWKHWPATCWTWRPLPGSTGSFSSELV